MKKLRDFKSMIKKTHPFQELKTEVPEFLEENLVDPARVINIFSGDPYAFIRIFYFQFLKLCFECQGVESQKKINQFMDLIEDCNSVKKGYFLFRVKGQKVNLSQENMKNLLLEFIQVLSGCKQTVSCLLARYHIIDKILVSFFINFLIDEDIVAQKQINKDHLNKQKILQFLSDYFQINMAKFDSCFQFVDSQIYIYVQNAENIYLVYIEDGSRNSQVMDENYMNSLFEKFDSAQTSKRSSISRSLELGSNINCQNRTIIFEGSQIVFNANDKNYTIASNTNSLMKKTTETLPETKQNFRSSVKTDTFQKSGFKALYVDVKQKNPSTCYRPDISNQFTNSKLLQSVLEPYRSSIKTMKSRARAERKSKQAFLI